MFGVGSSDDSGGVGRLRRKAMQMFEERVTNWAIQVRNTISEKRERVWDSEEDAIEGAQKAVEADKREDAIDDALMRIQQKFIVFSARYVDTQQNPEKGIDDLRDAGEDLLVELHNPSTREAILLAVEEEYRENVRNRLQEFGMLLWGILDMMEGRQSEEMWFATSVLAAQKNQSTAEIVAQMEGVKPEDVPEWVYEQDPNTGI